MNPLFTILTAAASPEKTGIWRTFVNFLSSIIEFLYKIVPNYGVAIILFTIITRLALLPLDIKSKKSTKKMNEVQPEIDALNKKYKNDPERLNKKTMELYKKHGVNPLGGCLPLLLQMPVTIALFAALRQISNFHVANQTIERFLWIKNIWAPDSPILDVTGKSISLGSSSWNGLFILPALSGITSYYQTQLMNAQQGGQKKEGQMSGMSKIMPIMSIWFTSMYTAAFALYWVASNVFQIAQMLILDKKSDKEKDKETPLTE
ncbi:MAG: YidC/Oxa1 family membrane protein insertase [Clostridiales bacterium]|nr:YidC/Oxa1 family membrane protein insertase [Clostridiales bacterium]